MVPVKPERLAQLEEFARRRGRSIADALDDVLAEYLEWERQGYQEAVEGIRQGCEDVKAGRTKPRRSIPRRLRAEAWHSTLSCPIVQLSARFRSAPKLIT